MLLLTDSNACLCDDDDNWNKNLKISNLTTVDTTHSERNKKKFLFSFLDFLFIYLFGTFDFQQLLARLKRKAGISSCCFSIICIFFFMGRGLLRKCNYLQELFKFYLFFKNWTVHLQYNGMERIFHQTTRTTRIYLCTSFSFLTILNFV